MSSNIENLELPELANTATESTSPLVQRELSLVGHVTVTLNAEIGTAELTIDQLFALKAGEVVKLLQQVNEPVTLRLNGKAIARGELVAVDDNFGVQITEIL